MFANEDIDVDVICASCAVPFMFEPVEIRGRWFWDGGLLGNPAFLRSAISPSAIHRLALTSCTTLMICLPDMTGNDTPAMTQGQKLSILFARASSNAPALHGLAKMVESEA